MKTQVCMEIPTPSAHIAVNKSRIKLYNKNGEMPTYYLQKGQEFMIELFNPTQGTILAKITLNGKAISQGGLVLKPGQRVFLDRYLDVAKKFLFDTYEVGKSEEIKKAIEKNGDFKVEFYRERIAYRPILINTCGSGTYYGGNIIGSTGGMGIATFTTTNNINSGNLTSRSIATSDMNLNATNCANTSNITPTSAFYSSSVHDGAACMDWMAQEKSLEIPKAEPVKKDILRSKKTIETGRVEEGSKSDQKLKTVNLDFDYWAFHTIEYKLLPVSQKVNTSEDINVKTYCTNCGTKLGKSHKFCSTCGTKA